jgi:hypothetical protein
LPASSALVPALSLTGDVEGGDEQDAAAARAFLAVAREAAAAAQGLPPGRVDVVGGGLIARRVRALVGDANAATAERPRAIVELTGDPEAIVAATRRVADLGVVVLAGETNERRTEINLYADVHRRGLTLVGVASPLGQGIVASPPEDDDALVDWCRESLVRVRVGSPAPRGPWYRVEG